MIRGFGSDNFSGVLPEVFKALEEAAYGHQHSYGEDVYSEKAIQDFKNVFGENIRVFFVYNGTGANILSLSAFTHSYNAVICAETAHINVDECGAIEKQSGCKLLTVPTFDGKLTTGLIQNHMHGFGEQHHSQPKMISLTQCTELGTVYTPAELKEICDYAHAHRMYVHMDGARIANACAALHLSLKELTVDCGIDILSFGGTKNGLMMGECVIIFNKDLQREARFVRKQSAQLASKMRYLSCQFTAYLTDDLWLKNAAHANAMASKLYQALKELPEVTFTQKPESNQLFLTMPRPTIDRMLESYFFYFWNEANHEIRLVTSFDTTEEDVNQFIRLLRR